MPVAATLLNMTGSQHPMDDFPVRPLRFDLDRIDDSELVWSRSCPHFSMFINALGLHVPYFERFLVRVMRAHRGELTDEDLLRDVRKIIGQEAHHAFNFVALNERLARRYPGIGALDAAARSYFERAAATRSKRFQIGFTAGYETFTFLGGMIILDRYAELMEDAEPHLRALWVWHQVEEVEHGAVAFDFYQAFYGEQEWYRRAMVLFAFAHIALETFRAYRCIVRVEHGRFRDRLRAWRFFAGFAKDLFAASLPVYRRDYHPSKHPICNDAQNRLAIAWRRHEAAGGDVLNLDRQTVDTMLAHPAP